MREENREVIKAFGLKYDNCKVNKSEIISKNNRDTVLIKKMFIDAGKILFCHNVKEHLNNTGFRNTDRYLVSSQNKPYFIHGDSIYVAINFIDSPAIAFNSINMANTLAKNLARIHKSCKSLVSDIYKTDITRFTDLFSKRLNEMIHIKKWVSKQSCFSEIDIVFIKNYANCYNKTLTAIKLIEGINFENNVTVCHNSIKEENIKVLENNDIFFTNFENCTYNHFAADISDLIRRMLKKTDVTFEDIISVMKSYEFEHKFTDEDIKLICAFLIFPSKFFKIINSHYNKKKTILSQNMVSRLKSCVLNNDISVEAAETILRAYHIV